MKLIERNMQTIIALCKMYKVNKLFVFGSILTERFLAGGFGERSRFA